MKKPMRYIGRSGGGYGWGEIYYDSETGKCYEESYHCGCVDLSEDHYDGVAEKDKKYVVSQPRIKNDALCLDISDEIVVNVNVAFLVIVHGIAFADLDFLNQPHQRGTV